RLAGEVLRFVSRAPGDHAQPEDEEKVPDTRGGERRLRGLGQAARQRKDGDDQLRGVPECRVEETAHPGARVLAEFFGREAEEPGERDDRETRDREDDDAGTKEQVEDPAQWDEEA